MLSHYNGKTHTFKCNIQRPFLFIMHMGNLRKYSYAMTYYPTTFAKS